MHIRRYEPGDKRAVRRLHDEALNEVVAMGALRRISLDAAEVKRMRVRPGLQGRGFGQAMLDSLHRRASRIGYTTLHLDTTVQQRAARGLYLKNGYREVGRGIVGPFDCIYYERGASA